MDQKQAAQELAKRLGVSLAAAAAGEPQAAPAPASRGWLAKPMPKAAALMADLKAQLPREIYDGILANLKRGAGYVVDESTNIALGSPPVDLYERGRIEQRQGFTIMRVRRKTPPA